jgi:small neutral amino acid transporter SnatA (MarC family)
MGVIERISGLMLILVGILLIINGLPRLSRFFWWVPPL